MIVCFQIDVHTQQIVGAWWEIGSPEDEDQELDCAYVDEISMVALAGTIEMYAKPKVTSWQDWWRHLSERTSFSTWFEIAEVDDESYGYELLYKTGTCNPRPVPASLEPYYPFSEARGWEAARRRPPF